MQTERQKEIIEVALKLISKKGIQGLTIKNLSKKIGITEPAIYRHFEDKIHILIAILELFKKNTEQIFKDELVGDKPAIDKIEHLFTRFFVSFSAKPSLVAVIFSEEIFRNEPMLIAKISDIINKNDKILIEIMDNGQRNGEIRNDVDARHLSIVIMGTLRIFVKKWQLSDYAFDLTKEGKKLIESIKLLIVK